MNQGSLFDYMDMPKVAPLSRVSRIPGAYVSWYICVYNEGDEVRAELSCPVEVEFGYVKDFHERIILVGPDGPHGASVRRRGPDDDFGSASEIDITVTRR